MVVAHIDTFPETRGANDNAWFDDVRFVVNREAVGTGGPSMLIETNGTQTWVLDQLIDSAPQPVVFRF